MAWNMDRTVRKMLLGVVILCTSVWVQVCGQGAVSTRHRLDTEMTGEAWHYGNFPNPRTEPEKCGRNRPSWVCDPDLLLETNHANELDHLINSIRGSTACPCDVSTCSAHDVGYTISIAVMKKMYRVTNDHRSLMDDARNFAFSLEKERWNFDRCDEDVLIVFSLKDNIVFAVTGMKAREKINDDRLYEIVMDSTQFFQHNPYMGLKHMIYAIRHALTNKYHRYLKERSHLSEIYSYKRARPRLAGTRMRGGGRIVGSYSSAAGSLQFGLVSFITLTFCWLFGH